MSAFPRRRPSLLLRLLVLAVVAFGSVGGALASALGEMHALSHAGHADAAHEALERDTGHDEDDLGTRLLHVLVHCGHCHGQGGMLPFAAPAWELMPPPAIAEVAAPHANWRPAPLESLLRPPISA